MVQELYLVVFCGEPGRWPDMGCLLWLRSQEGRSGGARSATAAVRAVPWAGHVRCPEAGPVFPWVCVPELPVWGESSQTFVILFNALAVCEVLGCCGVSLGVSPLQGWLGPGQADEPELELLFVKGCLCHVQY